MSQEFVILVSASPLKTQAHLTAIRFIQELVKKEITVRSVFFYQEAVLVASRFNSPPSDEPQVANQWKQLSDIHAIELQTCVAASFRRGILDTQEAKQQNFESHNLHESFKITGLGQLAAAMSDSNVKLIHFK
jgi:tRNA 2-thiouridine synthesizing protein D